jgi:hypothetical protein
MKVFILQFTDYSDLNPSGNILLYRTYEEAKKRLEYEIECAKETRSAPFFQEEDFQHDWAEVKLPGIGRWTISWQVVT